MNLQELIALLPSELNKKHLDCFYKAFNNKWVSDSPELFDLIEKGLLKISPNKDISRLEGYFERNNIEKIKNNSKIPLFKAANFWYN